MADRLRSYDSLQTFSDAARAAIPYQKGNWENEERRAWFGNATHDEALVLARDGWNEHLGDTLTVARHVVQTVERDHHVDTFAPVWDVTGSMVDVAAYLGGVPECMVDFQPTKVSNVGKVITLCASICVSGSTSPESLQARGKAITALALALADLGHACEMYADAKSGEGTTLRVKVKGTEDVLDPSKVLFMYAHPAAFRRLAFAVMPNGWPMSPIKEADHAGLPEGTIYVPHLISDTDVGPTYAQDFVTNHLQEIGLL